ILIHHSLRCPLDYSLNAATNTYIYTLSLHDSLPISAPARLAGGGLHRRQSALHRRQGHPLAAGRGLRHRAVEGAPEDQQIGRLRSEEHTSELQSRDNLV